MRHSPPYSDDESGEKNKKSNVRRCESDSEENLEAVHHSQRHCRFQYTELKEQIFNDKLTALNEQFEQLRNKTHPEYKKALKKFDHQYKERLRFNDIWFSYEMDKVEKEYQMEKKLALREFEEKKAQLKDNLLMELQEKREKIEQDRYNLDLNGDSTEYKGASTRKLRRRGAEPAPAVDKRRKQAANTANYEAESSEIDEDLRMLARGRALSTNTHNSKQKGIASASGSPGGEMHTNEPRIENGKLYFDKKWFHKGQPVMVECKDGTRFNATLTCTDASGILLRKSCDNSRMKISLGQLAHGKYLVRRRTNLASPTHGH